jgi:NAD(P)-dependent dehydrogenase (short-subunit alcohol dehydrogenase family)
MNTLKLEGKVALVTGGTAGIGLATAQHFAAEGAQVFIMGRRQAALDETVKSMGGKTIGVQGDVSKLADLDRLVDTIREKAGRLDVVFANAGGGEVSPFGSISEDHYAKTFDVNVKGVLFTVQKVLPLLAEGASVILIGSIAGSKGVPAFSVYNAAKAAIRSFARSWTVDLKDRKIRVNTLSPGPIDTPGLNAVATNEEEVRKFKTGLASTVPMGRLGTPDEIAKAAIFLASDDSSFITGIELFVDGGTAQI